MAAEHLTRKMILSRLNAIASRGRSLKPREMKRRHAPLWAAIPVHFSSYELALSAAGITPQRVAQPAFISWDRALILRRLREVKARGGDLSVSGIKKADSSLSGAIHRHFRCHDDALTAAGIDTKAARRPKGYAPKYTREWIVNQLRQLRAGGGELNSKAIQKNDYRLAHAIRRVFRFHGPALRAAGIDPEAVRKSGGTGLTWTRERIAQTLRELHARGEDLKPGAIRKAHDRIYSAALRQFGGYDAALEAAGIDPKTVRTHRLWATRGQLLRELRRRFRHGEDLSARHLEKADRPITAAIDRLFDRSRAKAFKAAGIDPRAVMRPAPIRKWTKEIVLQEIRRRHKNGEDLSATHLAKHKDGLRNGMVGRFGSHVSALKAAGIDPATVQRCRRDSGLQYWTDAIVLETLKQMHEGGSDLRHGTVKTKNQPLFYAAKRLFGSYANAVREAGINYWEMSQAQFAQSRKAAANA
ncbi:MAG: hypothetical protein JWL69_3254 [Phycisphaerales bacterium]|nr:hypothetical protein [Phycisphaerales bacterium]